MKKKLIMLLIFTFVFGIAGIAFADQNPFTDVPQGHWAYAAIDQLAAAGLIDGYNDGTFRGDRLATRYEMAQLVAKAMSREDQASADNKALIDKLAVEFADELNNLGVRVTKLEDKTKIAITYDSRIRYMGDSNKAVALLSPGYDPGAQGSNAFDFRQRINFDGQVNDQTSFDARLVTNSSGDVYNKDSIKFGSGSSASLTFDRLNFTFDNVLFDQVTIGRFGNQGVTNGLLVGNSGNTDGIKIESALGNCAKFTGLYVDVSPYSATTHGSNELGLANLDFKLGDNSGFNVAYETTHFSDISWPLYYDPLPDLFTRSYDVGAYTQLGQTWLTGEYVSTQIRYLDGETNVPNEHAWAVQLSNGVSPALYPTYDYIVDPSKAHSDAFALSYHYTDEFATPALSAFNGSAPAIALASPNNYNAVWAVPDFNMKGFGVTYQNVLSKDVIFTVNYQSLKSVDNSGSMIPISNYHDNCYNASLQFLF